MNPLRALHERWLLQAAEGPLPRWKRALLARALRRDPGLRRRALDLAEFLYEEDSEGLEAPDLVFGLKARLDGLRQERPLFPAAWMPVAAAAALALTALLVLMVRVTPPPAKGEASPNVVLAGNSSSASVPTVTDSAAPKSVSTASAPQVLTQASETVDVDSMADSAERSLAIAAGTPVPIANSGAAGLSLNVAAPAPLASQTTPVPLMETENPQKAGLKPLFQDASSVPEPASLVDSAGLADVRKGAPTAPGMLPLSAAAGTATLNFLSATASPAQNTQDR
jgi:hypothetical protein